MEGVISMGVGEPDFSTPWSITEAAIRSLEQGFTMYTSNAGMPELRKELSAYLKRTYGLEYDPATELLITNGVSEGLDLAVRAILDPGDEVIMPDPGYVAYPATQIILSNCTNGVIENVSLDKTDIGIYVLGSSDIQIMNCTLSSNLIGIAVISSTDIDILSNKLLNNSMVWDMGICVEK